MTRIAGLVLAAGEGRRLGRPKALVEVGGERWVDRAVRVLHEGGCDLVYVVAGAAALDPPGATVVENPGWRSGMASSLRCGLAALDDAVDPVDSVVVSLVDQPGIGARAVTRVVDRLREGRSLVVATYDGQPRNPVGIARALWPSVAASATGDGGARAFIAGNPALVTQVECGDVADPTDVDTPSDLEGELDA
ncbi:MAG: nucleotidyltransferase family protein [Actinomycetes bacterium]